MQDEGNRPGRLTYEGGFDAVIRQMEGRRDPMTFEPGEGFPPPGSDLSAMRDRMLGPLPEELRRSGSSFARKCRELHEEFKGQPEILYLNALLIANLRRRDQPPEAQPLFVQIWTDHAAFLIRRLDARWLVSSVTTFGEHGATEMQRRVGTALSVLFNTMKLYETERLFSGTAPDAAWIGTRRLREPLPLEMDPYAVTGGGLDVNMLGRIWLDAEQDPVIRPLAHHLLEALNTDGRSVFRRLRLMREARETPAPDAPAEPPAADSAGLFTMRPRLSAHAAPVDPARVETDPARLRWGTVSTVRAPLARVARFAAHHLRQGAARVTLYLDDADPAQAEWLSRHPRVEVIPCDAAHWEAIGRRPKAHQVRQSANATHAYRRSDLHWLAHIDVDEFLLPDRPVAEILARAPADIAVVVVPPVEQLAPTDPAAPAHFKTTARMGGRSKAVLPEIYPTFGEHLRGGYVSHLEGKCFARPGVEGAQFGIHALNLREKAVTNRAQVVGTYLGHAHAPSWEAFRTHLDFRMAHGSYRKKDRTDFRLADILDYLTETEGEAGLRQFYEEVCTATPRLIDALGRHGMLVTADLDLDGAVLAEFGALPPDGL